MECWFTTSHGKTKHINPNTPDYVPGEPGGKFRNNDINHRELCIQKGIARCGWPNTGDMREDHFGEGRLAPDGYSFETIENNHQRYLRDFSSILAGDLIVIPADEGEGFVHVGIVLGPDREPVKPYRSDRPLAYYYFHDIANGDYYELAHRVNVKWAKDEYGDPIAVFLSGLTGGIWQSAFSRVVKEKDNIMRLAQKYKLY